jgi:hypothetical protein
MNPTGTDEERLSTFEVMFEGKIEEPDHYEVMAQKEIVRPAGTVDNLLERIWCKTQNDDVPTHFGWRDKFCDDSPCRSSMMGDIFKLDDDFYIVASVGFIKMTEEQATPFRVWLKSVLQMS